MTKAWAASAAIFLLAACGGGGDSEFEVKYRVVHSEFLAGRFVVTYATNGAVSQSSTVASWTSSPTKVRPGQALYVSAQNQGAAGRVFVTIVVNGEEAKSASTSAPYGVATASMTCC